MEQPTSIALPIALKELIISNNELLKKHQEELTNKVISANEEMMKLMGLRSEDGWRLDISRMMYIKEIKNTES